jgi:hypothetical protein
MKTDSNLSRQLSFAAFDLRAQMPPSTLLPAIHRSLGRGRGRWKKRTAHGRWASIFGWAGLSTVAVALAAVLVVHSMVAGTASQSVETVSDSDGFVRLVSADAWQRAKSQDDPTWLVSAELPQSRLAALGLPYDPARAGERVPAELLIYSSGEVLAVRVNR